jgi:hypothetical protein
MQGVKLVTVVLALSLVPAPVLAQRGDRHMGQGKSNVTQEDRRRIREDVDSARDTYDRRDSRRQERMAPQEREKLRQDVQDANRDMRRQRR